MQPCLIYLHVISLVAGKESKQPEHGTKEMMQRCLIYLHVISLVASRARTSTSFELSTPTRRSFNARSRAGLSMKPCATKEMTCR